MPTSRRRTRWITWPLRTLLLVPLFLLGPIGVLAFGNLDLSTHWSKADTTGSREGIEVNILGLSAGIDFNDLALRLPGIGRL